jgi:fumarate reductase iron-sulfur subunit
MNMHAKDQIAPGKTEPGTALPHLTTLKIREIQSPLIACLLDEFSREIGHEKTMQVASTAIQKDALKTGQAMAQKYNGNSIQLLHRLIREGWAEDDALEISDCEETDCCLSFNVTRCQFAEMYARLGLQEFGYCLSCNRDASLIKGFNPHMKFSRTQTIMEGAKICDFRITLE